MPHSVEYEFDTASMTAAQFLSGVFVPLSEIAESYLQEGQSVGEFLDNLIEKGMYLDALRVTAHSLPTRRALWWGCVCLMQTGDQKSFSPEEQTALAAVVRQVASPSEANRAAAEEAANRVPSERPVYQLARAAGHRDLPMPAPRFNKKQDFRARGVFGALWLAIGEAEVAADGHEGPWMQFLSLGLEVSRGENLWPEQL